MNNKKLLIFIAIFVFAFGLILLGLLLDKKENKNGAETDKPAQETLVKEGEETVIEIQEKLPNIDELLQARKKLYDITEKDIASGEQTELLQHKDLNYELQIPKKDVDGLLVIETEEDGVTSTGFYYVTKDTKALVFSMNNYPNYVWDDYKDAVNDKVLGKTPIRVMTYDIASDIPFKPNTEEYKKYMYYLKKVPQYVKTFKFIQKEVS